MSTLAELKHLVWDKLSRRPAFIVAASTGGLVALLLIRRYGVAGVRGLINIEGNLAPEDCMFSRRVAAHTFDEFSERLFSPIQSELRTSRSPGDHMLAHSMALNTDVRAYYSYSFETVGEWDSSCLLDEFLTIPVPRLFLDDDANKILSYIPMLRGSKVEVYEVSARVHFLFYDNPVVTFQEIGKFVTKSAHHVSV